MARSGIVCDIAHGGLVPLSRGALRPRAEVIADRAAAAARGAPPPGRRGGAARARAHREARTSSAAA